MCPERGRPPPRNNCIHLHLCMHPVSSARVTMMENNNLLLYKLLCKDKVGGMGRGITVGKGRKESRMRELRLGGITGGKCSDLRGSIPLLCVCNANESCAIFIFFFFFELWLPPLVSLVLYSDCLQARRHFPVKVSLMNSNDPSDWLRQVIHNHSSFTFSSCTVTSPFFLPSLLLFLQLNQTPVPIKGRNLLSLSFFFFSFNCACWVEPLNHLLIRMDASTAFFLWRATRDTLSGNELRNTEPEVTDQPKVKAGFSHHSTQSDAMSIIYHHKHIWASLILLRKLSTEKCSELNNTSALLH